MAPIRQAQETQWFQAMPKKSRKLKIRAFSGVNVTVSLDRMGRVSLYVLAALRWRQFPSTHCPGKYLQGFEAEPNQEASMEAKGTFAAIYWPPHNFAFCPLI